MSSPFPYLGYGLGLCPVHYPYILNEKPDVDWFEIISENFMDTDGRPRRNLDKIRAHYPIVMHGVSLSIGTTDPLNSGYLRDLKQLIRAIEPAWISDHLCWTGVAHRNVHDLLPVPYTQEALSHIIDRIDQVQTFLGQPIALENPSTYLEFADSEMHEADFIAEMVRASGCGLLLDVNNVYVTCFNHRLNLEDYIDRLPLDRVVQIHLAGHRNNGSHIIDTHDDHVTEEVWQLYRNILERSKTPINTMIEWDDRIPEFPVLLTELEKAKAPETLPTIDALPNWTNSPIPVPNNTRLSDQQIKLQDAISAPTLNNATLTWVRPKPHLSADAQIGIYHHAYRARLQAVIAEDYPITHQYLGDAFLHLLDQCIAEVPAQHYNIARYRDVFHAYALEKLNDGFARDLLELETCIAHIADAPETPALQPEALQTLNAESVMESQYLPRAALRIMRFAHNIHAYYDAVVHQKSQPRCEATPLWLAVFRDDDAVWRLPLSRGEARLLIALQKEKTLSQAIDLAHTDMLAENEDVAALLHHYLQRWMQHRLLSHTHLPQAQSLERNMQCA